MFMPSLHTNTCMQGCTYADDGMQESQELEGGVSPKDLK